MRETVDTLYGRMTYFKSDRFIGKSLKLYGEYSAGEVALWRKLIKPGDRVLDIGANIGALPCLCLLWSGNRDRS